MRIRIQATLDAPAATVWEHVRTTRLLEYVAAPMMRFKALDPPQLPDVWPKGEHKVSMHLGGALPIGVQWIVISFPLAFH